MSDLVASWLRTVVPGLYSAVIGTALAWAAVHIPWVLDLLELLGIDPTSDAFRAGVVVVVLAVWYAGWRRLEPHLPDWLTRVVLGSAKAPTYQPAFPVAAYSSGETVQLTSGVIVTLGAIIMDPGARAASYQAFLPSGFQEEVRESDIVRRVSPSE